MPNLYNLEQCSARRGTNSDEPVIYVGSIQFSDGEGGNWGGSFHGYGGKVPFVANERYSVWHDGKHVFDMQALGADDGANGAVFAGIGPRPLEEDYN